MIIFCYRVDLNIITLNKLLGVYEDNYLGKRTLGQIFSKLRIIYIVVCFIYRSYYFGCFDYDA